jgi:hypothetical protein
LAELPEHLRGGATTITIKIAMDKLSANLFEIWWVYILHHHPCHPTEIMVNKGHLSGVTIDVSFLVINLEAKMDEQFTQSH